VQVLDRSRELHPTAWIAAEMAGFAHAPDST
jgi:hypothetical protein